MNENIMLAYKRLSSNKQMMPPDQESQNGDGDTRDGYKGVSENSFAREAADNFADHRHPWKNHDVHCRMRIEPKEVLKQYRIATHGRIEDARMENSFQPQ